MDFRAVDLRDLTALDAALQGIEVVVHLGGIDRSVAIDDAATMQVNVNGTWNLFEASRRAGVRRVIHCSSNSVTGLDQTNPTMPPCYLPIDEAHPLRPTDAYALSKLCGEQIAVSFARRGLEVIVLRPCFIAFPEQVQFMAGGESPAGRDEPKSYLCAYVGPEDCARGFAAAVGPWPTMLAARLSSWPLRMLLRCNQRWRGSRRGTARASRCATRHCINASRVLRLSAVSAR